MTSLVLTLVYLGFFVAGVAAPFALTLGYLWVDVFRPQEVAYTILPSIPVSALIGAAAITAYAVFDRRALPRPNAIIVLTILFILWCTMSTALWAATPDFAWWKWNWAVKTMIFSIFAQFVIRSRVQIEAFLQVYLFAMASNFMTTGLKTMMGGGGYGQYLTLGGTESSFSEGSTMSTIAISMLPVIFFLRKHTLIFPRSRLTDLGYLFLSAVALAGAIGTYARTAAVAMVVVGAAMWIRSKHKIAFGLAALVVGAAVMNFTSDAWRERISTIDDYTQESSAHKRVLVWEWTLGYVAEHPLGAGFGAHLLSEFNVPAGDGSERTVRGLAFHSIYFEVLGEQGWVGLTLFLGLIVMSFLALRSASRRARDAPDLQWARDLASALQVSLLTLLAGGAFVGIAFLPMLYYSFAMAAVLQMHVARATATAGPRAFPARATPRAGAATEVAAVAARRSPA